MLKQLFVLGFLALSPQVFGELYSYNGQSCDNPAKMHTAEPGRCVRLHGEFTQRVAGGHERGWYLYPSYDCKGSHHFVAVPEKGCIDEYSYGFVANSAIPIY